MKIFKLLPLLLILTLYNSTSLAGDCDSIKMDSSVNVIKKIRCKAAGGGSVESSTETSSAETSEEQEGGWKLWRKPEWMKKKN